MQTNRTILAAAAGFIGGFAVGTLLASTAGTPVAAFVSRRFRDGREAVDRGLRQVEQQLHEIDAALERTLEQFRDRTQAGSAGTAGPEKADWEVERGEVARELRHLPRR